MPATTAGDRSAMADAGRAASDAAGSLVESWRRLNTEQRVAAGGAILLVVSTFGPFSFVEGAVVLTGLGVLLLLRQRADRKRFHLPLGDGTVILAAALWSALLIVTRLFDRPLGQSVLALGCAAILAAAGLRERTKRPADDLPPEASPSPRGEPDPAATEPLQPDPDEEPTASLDDVGEDPSRDEADEPQGDPTVRDEPTEAPTPDEPTDAPTRRLRG